MIYHTFTWPILGCTLAMPASTKSGMLLEKRDHRRSFPLGAVPKSVAAFYRALEKQHITMCRWA